MAIIATGNISGSSISTGSFGSARIANNIAFGASSTTTIGNGSDTNLSFYIAGNERFKLYNHGGNIYFASNNASGPNIYSAASSTTQATYLISGRTNTGWGGGVDKISGIVAGTEVLQIAANNISGSSTSTGSFGSLVVSDAVQGNLTVEGDVIAKQYIVSSSVTHLTASAMSGSTVFGDTSSDTHQFTGSLLITGSLTVDSGSVNLNNAVDLSGSAPSTASFGSAIINGVGDNAKLSIGRATHGSADLTVQDGRIDAGLGATDGYNFHDFGANFGFKGLTSPSRLAVVWDSTERLTVTDNVRITGSLIATGNISGSYNSTASFSELIVRGNNAATNLTVTGLVTGHGHSDSNNRFTFASGTEINFYDSNGTIKRDTHTMQYYSKAGHKFLFGDANYGLSIGTNTVTGYGLRVNKSGSSGVAIIADDAGSSPWIFNESGSNEFSGSSTSTGSFGVVHGEKFRFNGDTNTGISKGSADQLAITLGGTARYTFAATEAYSSAASRWINETSSDTNPVFSPKGAYDDGLGGGAGKAVLITNSLPRVAAYDSGVEFPTADGQISGSATSTGSFGALGIGPGGYGGNGAPLVVNAAAVYSAGLKIKHDGVTDIDIFTDGGSVAYFKHNQNSIGMQNSGHTVFKTANSDRWWIGADGTWTGSAGAHISASADSTGSFGRVEASTITGTLGTAAQTNITSVGTIGTGVWNGTAIASAYLDSDTAHLSGTQTFTGDKTFSATLNTAAITSTGIIKGTVFQHGTTNSNTVIKANNTGIDVDIQDSSGNSIALFEGSNKDVILGNDISGSATSTGSFGAALVAGHVGIGTKSPTQMLEVAGDVRIGSARSLFFKRHGDNYAWRVRNESAADGSTYGFNGSNDLIFEVVGASQTNEDPSDSSHTLYASSANTLVLQESGQVGIKVADPQYTLDVGGTFNTSGNINIKSSLIVTTDANKVGIGTTVPAEKLTVLGSISSSGDYHTDGEVKFYDNAVFGARIKYIDSTNRLSIQANEISGDAVEIFGNDYTYIGTADSTNLLTLEGNNKISGSAISTGSFGSLVVADAVQGSLTVEGDIIANRYIVSSSVTHLTQSLSSGSTIFGDTVDDTHQFTGSLSVSKGGIVGTVSASSSTTGATSIDMSQSTNFEYTLTGDVTFTPTNLVPGQSGVITLIQDGTGGRTVSLNSLFKTPRGDSITFETGADTVSLLSYYIASTSIVAVNYMGDFS